MSGKEMGGKDANEDGDVMIEYHRYRCCSADEMACVFYRCLLLVCSQKWTCYDEEFLSLHLA
jgi:hypothetical protein